MKSKGWNTTDEDEISVRQKRASKEQFGIKNLERRGKVFSSYKLQSKKTVYHIELRSLQDNINSCSCPDIAVNKLGTCKHIEAIKLQFKNKKYKSKYIEIFLDTRVDTIKILYPNKKSTPLKEQLDQYFSANGELLYDPLIAFKSLQRKIKLLDELDQKKIRISSFIEPWLQEKRFEKEKIENKKNFLNDYREGKRSFDFLKYPLYDYQKEGVLHLAFNERALLADDMGLGKTIQAIGASVLLQKLKNIQKVLVVTPASLKTEWEEQIEKFTDLPNKFIFGNKDKRVKQYDSKSFFYLANYEQILYDYETINTVLQPDIIILDEAQRIKNWQTKTANSIKRLQSRYAFVLTGTPIENRIDEIYSIVQFLDPKFFGPLFRFNREFYNLDDNGVAIGYKNMNLLHKKLTPIMLRRKKSQIEDKLPKRTDKTYFVQMDQTAQDRYDEYEMMVKRFASKARKMPLMLDELKKLQLGLSCMRILCDSVYILNQKFTSSPKIEELLPILEELLEEKNRKIIIFSEWEKMLELLHVSLEQKNIDVAWHTGSYSQIQRKKEIEKFKSDDNCNIFLSTDSGSLGLNLQVANVVINLDMPWNPAKLEQRIARAWRKNQTKVVQVINLITEDRLEHRIVEIVKQKQFLSDNVLDGLGKDELNLPSTRQEFLDNVEKIINNQPNDKENPKSEQQNPKHFAEDIVSVHSDRIEKITQNQQNDTIFVVVDKKDKKIESTIEDFKTNNNHQGTIEVLQKSEYEMLQNLAKQGFIELKDDLEVLYTTTKSKKIQKLDPQKIIKIKEIFDLLKRKYDMGKLLYDSGFEQESIEPFCKMADYSLQIIQILKEDDLDIDDRFNKEFLDDIQAKKEMDEKYIVSNSNKLFDAIFKYIELKC